MFMILAEETAKAATSWPDVALAALPIIAMIVVIWIIFR